MKPLASLAFELSVAFCGFRCQRYSYFGMGDGQEDVLSVAEVLANTKELNLNSSGGKWKNVLARMQDSEQSPRDAAIVGNACGPEHLHSAKVIGYECVVSCFPVVRGTPFMLCCCGLA